MHITLTMRAVSVGEAEMRMPPCGDHDKLVMGTWRGWDNTCTELVEGLHNKTMHQINNSWGFFCTKHH